MSLTFLVLLATSFRFSAAVDCLRCDFFSLSGFICEKLGPQCGGCSRWAVVDGRTPKKQSLVMGEMPPGGMHIDLVGHLLVPAE